MGGLFLILVIAWGLFTPASGRLWADEALAPDYERQVAPLLRKYCAGCHNRQDAEGELAVDSYEALMRGGAEGKIVTAGQGDQSRLVQVLTGQAEPAMPPEDHESPQPAEIAVLRAWIDAGAKAPSGQPAESPLAGLPSIGPTADVRPPVTAVAVSPQGDLAAVARYRVVHLQPLAAEPGQGRPLEGHPGRVNAVTFSSDGLRLVAAAGEPGLFGEARLWDVADGRLVRAFRGHDDSLYAARLSPDGKLLATAGYDQRIVVWDAETGQALRTLQGHNGPVFDLAFHPNGRILASASGDRTVKLWDVSDGGRLDTLSQSLKELYTLAFSPDGHRLAAGGVDNRIRLWQISASGQEGTNGLLHSRFAHEAAILRLAFSPDGHTLVSSAEDRLVKVWDARSMRLRTTLQRQPDWVSGLAVAPDNQTLLAGRLDGSVQRLALDAGQAERGVPAEPLDEVPPLVDYGPQPPVDQLPRVAESEPNDTPEQATPLELPVVATGRIFSSQGDAPDVDLYRFQARAGDQWVLETNAARSGSPLDTKIEVLHADGRPVQRLVLRAVRDSELEFRGMNSEQLGARLLHWEEIELNQYVYINGEVVKHYQQRRGPDSDAQFYPEGGQRFTYFDTTARAHPLGQPCYVVVPYPPGTRLPDNGLPLLPVYFENDDDARRQLGSDSRLTFVAPEDGTYLVRVSDVRGFAGPDFHYQLIVRRPQPGFRVSLSGTDPTVAAGSGKSFTVKAERTDNFNGPIRVDIAGLPPGFHATSPLVIQAGHLEARGVISAAADAPEPAETNADQAKVTASAEIAGRTVTQEAGKLGTIKLAPAPKLIVHLLPSEPDQAAADQGSANGSPPEITIVPGSSVTCRLQVDRQGFDGRIQLDVENLPHGVIVDDIGLNGVLIPEGQTERTIYLTAASWVPPTSRLFHAVAKAEGNQASLPMLLHVQPQPKGP